jgi:hypothetical protein
MSFLLQVSESTFLERTREEVVKWDKHPWETNFRIESGQVSNLVAPRQQRTWILDCIMMGEVEDGGSQAPCKAHVRASLIEWLE